MGIAISLIFGIRRSRGSILVGISRSASLLSEVAHELPKLKVFYNDKELEEELIWVSGFLVNEGNQDIGKSIVAEYPILKLFGNAVWREFSLTALSGGLSANGTIRNEKEVEVSWNILQSNETLPFFALIGTTDETFAASLRAGQGMSVTARIENVRCAFAGQIASVNSLKSMRRSAVFIVCYLALIFAGFWLANSRYAVHEEFLGFELPNRPGVYYDYFESKKTRDGKILIFNISNPKDTKIVTEAEAHSMHLSVRQRTDPLVWYGGFGFALVYLILIAFEFWTFMHIYRRYRYLNRDLRILDFFWTSSKRSS